MKELKQLTKNEKGYLQIAFDNGYRWIATDRNGAPYFYIEKPEKGEDYWCRANGTTSLISFDTSWDDKEPTSIADLLDIDDTNWDSVEPMTKVLVSDDGEEWEKAYFVGKNKFKDDYQYCVIERWYVYDIRKDIELCKNKGEFFDLDVTLGAYQYCKIEETHNEN